MERWSPISCPDGPRYRRRPRGCLRSTAEGAHGIPSDLLQDHSAIGHMARLLLEATLTVKLSLSSCMIRVLSLYESSFSVSSSAIASSKACKGRRGQSIKGVHLGRPQTAHLHVTPPAVPIWPADRLARESSGSHRRRLRS